MVCSTRVLCVLSVCAVGVFDLGCSSFTTAGDADTEVGASSSGDPVASSSTSGLTDPSLGSTTDLPSSSSTGAPTASTTDTSATDTSATDTSATDASTTSSSGESGQGCELGELCEDRCVDTQTDAAHCGGCEDACSTQNTTPTCVGGECLLSCEDGFDNCDTDVGTGCEQSLGTPAHCGACDVAGTAEICDGIDNDCAAGLLIDEGCPLDANPQSGGFGSHELFGGEGGSPFMDVCPIGAALVGFSGNVGGNIDRIRGECAVMSLDVNTAVSPYGYAITSGATTPLPLHGLNTTTPFSIGCSANSFVVGITGNASGAGLHDVTIHCAEMLVDGEPGSFAVTYGPITTETVDGSIPGTAYSDLLSEPAVVDRYRGRAGQWVDAIGIGEAAVTLEIVG